MKTPQFRETALPRPSLRCQLQGVGTQITQNFCSIWLQIGGSQDHLLGFIHLLEHLKELREVLMSTGLLYNKGYDDTDEQPNEEIHRVRPGMVPSAGASVTTKLGCAVWMCLPT